MEIAGEDEISAKAESHLSAVCANVMRDVAIPHAIVSFDLNICELVRKRTHVHRPWAGYFWLFTSEEPKAIHCMTHTLSPGARFSKLPVITGPVKLFCFPFQMGVSKLLKIIL